MGKMEIGIYDVLDQVQMESHALAADVYDEHIRGAQEAEQMGYKYYFSIEHQTSDVSFLSSPSVYLTALARATSAMRFGVMIYQLPFHHPIRLAEDVAMLDHLSRGRVEFGAGTGVTSHEFFRWNVDFDRRRDISQEVLDIVLMAWKEGSVTYNGEFFQFDEALTTPEPFQKPHPPVWFGCHSAASFEYAAKMNFHVSQNIDTDPVIADKFETWRKLWRAEGHPTPMPKTFLTRHVHVAETDEKAREQVEAHLATAVHPSAAPAGRGRDIIGATRVGHGPEGMGRRVCEAATRALRSGPSCDGLSPNGPGPTTSGLTTVSRWWAARIPWRNAWRSSASSSATTSSAPGTCSAISLPRRRSNPFGCLPKR